jgi:molybdopterin synthase sulfur carrier subunit
MQLRVYATLRDLLSASQFGWQVSDGATIEDILEHLVTEKPALDDKLWDKSHKLTGYVQVFVNGRAIQYLNGLDTPVADSDTISLFPPVGGG